MHAPFHFSLNWIAQIYTHFLCTLISMLFLAFLAHFKEEKKKKKKEAFGCRFSMEYHLMKLKKRKQIKSKWE